MNLIGAFVVAFSMYSRIPMPRMEWTKERMRYMFCFFPLIGAAIGALMVLWRQYGGYFTGEGNFRTAVLVLIPVLVTGGIHMDGFLDTSDAINSYKPVEEKLEILKDSHSGAFAILMGICYFVLTFGVYSEATTADIEVLAIGFVLSRALSALSVVTFKKAKKSGLVHAFSDAAQKKTVGITMICYIAVCLALMLAVGGIGGAVCFAAAAAAFGYYRWMSYSKFGGTTGDLAGFFVQTCELAMAAAVVIAGRLLG